MKNWISSVSRGYRYAWWHGYYCGTMTVLLLLSIAWLASILINPS